MKKKLLLLVVYFSAIKLHAFEPITTTLLIWLVSNHIKHEHAKINNPSYEQELYSNTAKDLIQSIESSY